MRAAVIISAASAFIGVAMADNSKLAINRCDSSKTSFDASKIYLSCWKAGGNTGDTVKSGVDLGHVPGQQQRRPYMAARVSSRPQARRRSRADT